MPAWSCAPCPDRYNPIPNNPVPTNPVTRWCRGLRRAAGHPGARPLRLGSLAPVAVVVVVGAVLGGCAGAPAPEQAVLQTPSGFHPGSAGPTCLLHQTQPPTSDYQGGPTAAPEPELTFLAYYSATGNREFCDSAPPTALDKNWAQLYAQLTGNPAPVARLLG